MRRTLVPALASLLLAACGGADTSPRVAATGPGPSSAAVTDCGTFHLSQGEDLADSASRCLLDAVQAGRPARLKVTRPSTEGDPIPTTYTARSDRRVEVITDSRQDKFGAQVITRAICTGPSAAPWLEFAECSESSPVPD